MSEIASEVADGLHHLAESIETFAGAMSHIAAAEHSDTAGRMREMAAVIYHTSRQRFGGVKHDGVPIDQSAVDMLDVMWLKLFGFDPKKLPKR